MTNRADGEWSFGMFDGLVTVAGLVIGLLHAGVSPAAIAAGAVGVAVASMVSMGAGEWLGDSDSSVSAGLVMAAATAVGTMAVAAPYMILDRGAATVTAVGVVIAVAAFIAELRTRGRPNESRLRSNVETFACLFIALAATVLVTAI